MSFLRPKLIQQAASYGPDHQLLLCVYPQFVLDAVDSVADGNRLIASGLRDPGVGLSLGKQR